VKLKIKASDTVSLKVKRKQLTSKAKNIDWEIPSASDSGACFSFYKSVDTGSLTAEFKNPAWRPRTLTGRLYASYSSSWLFLLQIF
jgi:hypothetical protein